MAMLFGSGFFGKATGFVDKAKGRVAPGGIMAKRLARYQIPRTAGLGQAMSGNVRGMWGMNAVRAGGINAAAGGAYGYATGDPYDRGGSAMRGAMMGVGMGVAGRGALSLASKRGGAYRNQTNGLYNRMMGRLY